jgi:hypothetical protein
VAGAGIDHLPSGDQGQYPNPLVRMSGAATYAVSKGSKGASTGSVEQRMAGWPRSPASRGGRRHNLLAPPRRAISGCKARRKADHAKTPFTVRFVPVPSRAAVRDPQNRLAPTNSYADGELVSTSPFGDTNLSVPSRAKLSCQPWSCHR